MSALIRSYALQTQLWYAQASTWTYVTHTSTSKSLKLSPPDHQKVECSHISTRCAALSLINMIIGQVSSVWPINILSTSEGLTEVR